MKLTVTLSPTEQANIHGWVNYYLAHPDQKPTRIVLSERTQERLREVAAQFAVVPAVDPIPYPWGAPRRELPVFGAEIVCLRLDVPADARARQAGYTSIFEYRGEPALRELTLSRAPGDFASPLARSVGMQASIFWSPTAGQAEATLAPGGTYYFNFRNVDPTANRPAMIETSWPAR